MSFWFSNKQCYFVFSSKLSSIKLLIQWGFCNITFLEKKISFWTDISKTHNFKVDNLSQLYIQGFHEIWKIFRWKIHNIPKPSVSFNRIVTYTIWCWVKAIDQKNLILIYLRILGDPTWSGNEWLADKREISFVK